jgi:RNA ligase (TIGR02306 family)
MKMSERKMATIRKISKINQIDGADAIELAHVDGWQSVVKKGEYKEGDVVVYLEVDSWVPHELAPFLSKGKELREFNGVRGERLKTIKLRGVLSQGLILPITQQIIESIGHVIENQIGVDVSELLNIQKYEKPIPARLSGTVKGNFPSLIPKTDQERVQNLNEFVYGVYEVTEKLEGSSMTVGMVNGEFIVCSRNLNLKEDENNAFWKVARKYDIEKKMLDAEMDNIVFQGELIGPNIQDNIYNLKDYMFVVFDVFDVENQQYLCSDERIYLTESLKLDHVPVIYKSFIVGKDTTTDELLQLAEGCSSLNPKQENEGIVFKHKQYTDVSFKAISNKYLLREK